MEGLEVDSETRRRLIFVNVFKGNYKVGRENRRRVSIAKNAGFPLDRMFCPNACLFVNFSGVFFTLALAHGSNQAGFLFLQGEEETIAHL